MARERPAPATPATAMLKRVGVAYTEHLYEYVDGGGTAASSAALGVDEHQVVKTLVFEDDHAKPLIVLMHGDRQVSAKELARQIGCARVAPCRPDVAERHSGYQVGGTSPFGLRKPMPVYVERSILALPRLYINGGRRGFLVGLAPGDLARVLDPVPVEAASAGP